MHIPLRAGRGSAAAAPGRSPGRSSAGRLGSQREDRGDRGHCQRVSATDRLRPARALATPPIADVTARATRVALPRGGEERCTQLAGMTGLQILSDTSQVRLPASASDAVERLAALCTELLDVAAGHPDADLILTYSTEPRPALTGRIQSNAARMLDEVPRAHRRPVPLARAVRASPDDQRVLEAGEERCGLDERRIWLRTFGTLTVFAIALHLPSTPSLRRHRQACTRAHPSQAPKSTAGTDHRPRWTDHPTSRR